MVEKSTWIFPEVSPVQTVQNIQSLHIHNSIGYEWYGLKSQCQCLGMYDVREWDLCTIWPFILWFIYLVHCQWDIWHQGNQLFCLFFSSKSSFYVDYLLVSILFLVTHYVTLRANINKHKRKRSQMKQTKKLRYTDSFYVHHLDIN